jgi:YD repeat-containing protein
VDPVYDARGNTTKVPVPGDEANHYYTLTYDAWNRLVKVEDGSDPVETVAEYRYDGLGRRIKKVVARCPAFPVR